MPDRVAGDFDYEARGAGYAVQRRPDPRIAAPVHAALGDAERVLNVGAGAGSYEPLNRDVVAVEPSAAMRAQRPAHLSVAIDATAESLPFDDNAFDAAMAMVTIHQWPDLEQGLRELRRVSSGPVVILTADPSVLDQWWLASYCPELFATECRRMPQIQRVRDALGGTTTVNVIPVPLDCTDGFAGAYYGRPEAFLRPEVRNAQSAWNFVDPAVVDRSVEALRNDLESGEWDRRWGHLRTQPVFDGAMRLVTAG
jgi:SAM-dependent methyltransferase